MAGKPTSWDLETDVVAVGSGPLSPASDDLNVLDVCLDRDGDVHACGIT